MALYMQQRLFTAGKFIEIAVVKLSCETQALSSPTTAVTKTT